MGYPGITRHVTYPRISHLILLNFGMSTVIPTYTSLSLFSVGKVTGWYKSGFVRLTLCILFCTKYQRDILG